MADIEFRENIEAAEYGAVLELYKTLGWGTYTQNPDGLQKALQNSTYVVGCYADNRLIGLVRSLSDDVSIHYLQDILVHPDFQRQGIGKQLVQRCIDRFRHVRTHLLLTDDREQQQRFYQSCGYTNLRDIHTLNAFITMQ
jgi:GNAT superfamily N-acetyltransferase